MQHNDEKNTGSLISLFQPAKHDIEILSPLKDLNISFKTTQEKGPIVNEHTLD